MKVRYSYRFYPTDQQRQSLAQLFGCTRVVWNDALAFCKSADSLPNSSYLSNLLLTQAKRADARRWLNDVSSVPLQQSLIDLNTAYKNYFESLSGKRKGKKVKAPKFKKKQGKQSARFVKTGFSIKDGKVYLAKIGDVSPIWSREIPSNPSSVTVLKDAANRYFLSFVVDVFPVRIPAKNPSVGIDLGIKTFAVLSTGGRVGTGMHSHGGSEGDASPSDTPWVRRREYLPGDSAPCTEPAHEKVASPSYTKLDKRIRRKQRQLARQIKGSNRRNKTKLQIAKLHNKIADKRKDFLHKLSTRIVNENQVIVLEDLNVSGMMKNRKLSRAIGMQGWSEFKTLTDSKSKAQEREFKIISRWEPTSQIHAECGFRWGKLNLSTRIIRCMNCGEADIDRDVNAARNIEKVGTGHGHDYKRTLSDCQTSLLADCDEALRITAPLGR